MKKILTLAFVLGAVLIGWFYFGSQQMGYHPCGKERQTYCTQAKDFELASCLWESMTTLSSSCKTWVYKRVPISRWVADCKSESAQFCSAVPSGDGRVARCLMHERNAARLSGLCRHGVERFATTLPPKLHPKNMNRWESDCASEIGKFCKNVVPGDGRVARCLLQKNESRLSFMCKDSAAKFYASMPADFQRRRD